MVSKFRDFLNTSPQFQELRDSFPRHSMNIGRMRIPNRPRPSPLPTHLQGIDGEGLDEEMPEEDNDFEGLDGSDMVVDVPGPNPLPPHLAANGNTGLALPPHLQSFPPHLQDQAGPPPPPPAPPQPPSHEGSPGHFDVVDGQSPQFQYVEQPGPSHDSFSAPGQPFRRPGQPTPGQSSDHGFASFMRNSPGARTLSETRALGQTQASMATIGGAGPSRTSSSGSPATGASTAPMHQAQQNAAEQHGNGPE